MVNVSYIGDISPIDIRIGGTFLKNWSRGEVRVVDKELAEKLIANKNFAIIKSNSKEKVEKKEEVKEEQSEDVDCDLDGDGDVDEDDASLAGKTMAHYRKTLKKDK